MEHIELSVSILGLIGLLTLCYCNVLALYRRDFTRLIEGDENLRETISRVAHERLGDAPS